MCPPTTYCRFTWPLQIRSDQQSLHCLLFSHLTGRPVRAIGWKTNAIQKREATRHAFGAVSHNVHKTITIAPPAYLFVWCYSRQYCLDLSQHTASQGAINSNFFFRYFYFMIYSRDPYGLTSPTSYPSRLTSPKKGHISQLSTVLLARCQQTTGEPLLLLPGPVLRGDCIAVYPDACDLRPSF